MQEKLVEKLGLKYQPVGIWFTDAEPENVIFPRSDKRSCVVDLMRGVTNGRDIATTDVTTTCPGGAVGLCFGDAFTRRNHFTNYLLSMGKGAPGGENVPLPPHMAEGERFYDCPETVQKWRDELPFAEAGTYVVMRRLDHWANTSEAREPDLVWMLVNPDQISAMVASAGYRTGRACNMIAPQCAACQSVMYAYQQIGTEEPQMVLGAFDLAQRSKLDAGVLSLTMPYAVFAAIADDCEVNALSSHSWIKVRNRI